MKASRNIVNAVDTAELLKHLTEVSGIPMDRHRLRVLINAGVVEVEARRVGRYRLWTQAQKERLSDERLVLAMRCALRPDAKKRRESPGASA